MRESGPRRVAGPTCGPPRADRRGARHRRRRPGLDPIEQCIDRVYDEADVQDLLEYLVALQGLSTRAVTVLQLRHGLTGQPPMTLDEIGKRFGVTRERIRQIEKKALDALRERGETH
ncbi:sigma factor-like helix-turn-helix DNA-binding protein [Janibacter sp. G349]|uniref:sigma factor-like helix-turn-helix DNA-binding protein n=1 Tax=Janibacter sp. G349 TaxID=3405424 RepID=UPI003B768327